MNLQSERGVGLAELAVTMGVVLTVLGITTQILMQSGRAFTNGSTAMEARNNNAAGIDMMERLIRQATTIVPDPDANGVFDTIRVVADWNPRDGNVTGPYETVTFTTGPGARLLVQDSTMAAPVEFAEGVAQLRFTYLDHLGAALPAASMAAKPELIGMVGIVVQGPAIDGAPANVSRSTVAIRRVK